jgi:hypothetical protein
MWSIPDVRNITLRFLQEGSELAVCYPKFETLRSFRNTVKAEGNEELLTLALATPNTVHEVTTKYNTAGQLLSETKETFGPVTPEAKVGDKVAVLHGCKPPVILHKIGDGHYRLVGDASIYGHYGSCRVRRLMNRDNGSTLTYPKYATF